VVVAVVVVAVVVVGRGGVAVVVGPWCSGRGGSV